MNDWDQEVIEAGDEEKQFTSRLLLTGDKVGAAKGTIVPPNTGNAVAARVADKALKDPGVQAHILALMEEAGISELDVVKTLGRNLKARKMGIVQKTGEVVDVGEDGMVQIQAAKMLGQGLGWYAGGAKVETERESTPSPIQVTFNVRDVRRPKEDDDVIDGEYTVSS